MLDSLCSQIWVSFSKKPGYFLAVCIGGAHSHMLLDCVHFGPDVFCVEEACRFAADLKFMKKYGFLEKETKSLDFTSF